MEFKCQELMSSDYHAQAQSSKDLRLQKKIKNKLINYKNFKNKKRTKFQTFEKDLY